MNTHEAQRFPVDTFTPAPRLAKSSKIVAAQAKIEALLFLRHGEQQLLSMVIPVAMLVGLSLFRVNDLADPVQRIFPMTLAIAVMGAGFTGQAIAVAFDRRYGALKRIGASGVPTWALIGGKVAAVTVVVMLQVLVLSVVAVVLGWEPGWGAVPGGLIMLVLGVTTFTSAGLLLGGTLSSEMVLALANTIWFVLLGTAVYVAMMGDNLATVPRYALMMIPSVALSEGFHSAVTGGGVNMWAVAVLLVWTFFGVIAARRFFRFTMESD